MSGKIFHYNQYIRRILVGYILVLASFSTFAATVEEGVLTHLDQLRAIRAEGDRETVESYNRQMDEAWKFFSDNKEISLPILRKELSLELAKESPSDLILLDVGYFIRLQESDSDKELGRNALFTLDTTAKIVRWNQQQLFMLAHAVAPDQDPRILPFLDKAFLRNDVTAFIPQHSLKLDETLVCVFLYGLLGKSSEQHLVTLLNDKSVAQRIIEILIWIGSPDSNQAVCKAMASTPEYGTFTRATAFLMRNGGPEGRNIMLAVDQKKYDTAAQEYYAKVKSDIEKTSYDVLRNQFAGILGDANLSGEELNDRLSAMYENYGKDDTLSPEAIINSELPTQSLINELRRIKQRMFYRISDEALGDIDVTNAILNTLHYRKKEQR